MPGPIDYSLINVKPDPGHEGVVGRDEGRPAAGTSVQRLQPEVLSTVSRVPGLHIHESRVV